MTEDRIRELLREMHDEPVPADSLARVRVSVGERMQRRSHARWIWLPWSIAAVAVAIVCVGMVLLPRKPAPVQKAGPAVVREQSIAREVMSPPKVVKPAGYRRANKLSVKPSPPPADPVLIRIETPDPDVVILLVGDGG